MKKLASIDIGSHTARMLIAEYAESPTQYYPLMRAREYIRLAQGFNKENGFLLTAKAIHQTVEVLEKFVSTINRFHVRTISAVATGVVRRAVNREDLLEAVRNSTGISVKIISGEEEARLTDVGVCASLSCSGNPRIVFDLGGGSTEFIFSRGEHRELKSIPLGAAMLTQKFFSSDPPTGSMLHQLSGCINEIIDKSGLSLMKPEKSTVIGTGGTVTTLAAIANHIEVRDIRHEILDKATLKMSQIVSIFDRFKTMNRIERSQVIGLDKGRADVILAGIMVVIRILHFFKGQELMVSLSDLLEGLILDHLKENENER
jgi:exopolyphosphatase/guanosine-5'-triphosphate,3'-diphosphate pyrophosphatase